MHGLIIDHEIINNNNFNVKYDNKNLNFNFHRKFSHIECEKDFLEWLKTNKYNIKKIYILTSLIYLNIATLHHYPYDHLLYGLGHYMLWDFKNNKYLH